MERPDALQLSQRLRAVRGLILGTALVLAAATSATAESAWVRDEVRLNVRTGAGTGYRIVDSIGTGDRVTILRRSEGWTQVKLDDGTEGYIPAGFLQQEAPAAIRLAALEGRVADLSQELEQVSAEERRLREENEALKRRDGEQRATIEQLSLENRDLKAGERWPYLIAGAGILCAGMLVGAIVQAIGGGRRAQRRIRL